MGDRLEERVGPRAIATVALVAAVVHGALLWLYWAPAAKLPWGDEHSYIASAARLLTGARDWMPEPLWPPLYPRFVAGASAAAGGSVLGVQLLQTLMLAVTAVVLADLTRRVSGSAKAAIVAGGLAATYPPLVAYAHFLWPEVLHLFLFISLLWILVARWNRLAWLAVAGLLLGLALLTKSLLAPFAPILLGAGVLRRPASRIPLRLLVVVAATVVTVAPTAAARHRETGRWMIADSSAFNLWVGLNDEGARNFENDIVWLSYLEWRDSSPDFAERNRILWRRIGDELRRRPVVETLRRQLGRQYFRLLDDDSYLTNQLPGGVAVRRWQEGYVEAPRAAAAAVRWLSWSMYAALLVSAPIGWVLWRQRERRWAWVLLSFAAYNLGLFFWLHATTRYRVQLLPILFIGAGCAVAWWAAGRPPRERWRTVAAVLIAGVLLVFAFGGAVV